MSGRRHESRHRTRTRFRFRSITAAWLASACLAASLVALGYANGGVPASVPLALAAKPATFGAFAGSPPTIIDAANGGAASGGSLAGQPVATTPEGLLELLSRLLPPGEITGAYRVDGRGPGISLRFTRGNFHNYLTLRVAQDRVPTPAQLNCTDAGQAPARCMVLANGAVAKLFGAPGCETTLQARVQRLDGVVIQMGVSSCTRVRFPPYEPGTSARNGRQDGILSPAEAALIATDDQWNLTMRPELVDAGLRHYATLPKVTLIS